MGSGFTLLADVGCFERPSGCPLAGSPCRTADQAGPAADSSSAAVLSGPPAAAGHAGAASAGKVPSPTRPIRAGASQMRSSQAGGVRTSQAGAARSSTMGGAEAAVGSPPKGSSRAAAGLYGSAASVSLAHKPTKPSGHPPAAAAAPAAGAASLARGRAPQQGSAAVAERAAPHRAPAPALPVDPLAAAHAATDSVFASAQHQQARRGRGGSSSPMRRCEEAAPAPLVQQPLEQRAAKPKGATGPAEAKHTPAMHPHDRLAGAAAAAATAAGAEPRSTQASAEPARTVSPPPAKADSPPPRAPSVPTPAAAADVRLDAGGTPDGSAAAPELPGSSTPARIAFMPGLGGAAADDQALFSSARPSRPSFLRQRSQKGETGLVARAGNVQLSIALPRPRHFSRHTVALPSPLQSRPQKLAPRPAAQAPTAGQSSTGPRPWPRLPMGARARAG